MAKLYKMEVYILDVHDRFNKKEDLINDIDMRLDKLDIIFSTFNTEVYRKYFDEK